MIVLSCPDSYKTTPREEIDKVVNGCGPGNWKLDFVPDKLRGNNFTEACNIHDWRYYLGGNELDRLQADVELLSNMLLICGKECGTCLDAGDVLICFEYFTAVRKFGAKHFGG